MKAKAYIIACILMLTPIISFGFNSTYISDSAEKGVILKHVQVPDTTHLRLENGEQVLALVKVETTGKVSVVDLIAQHEAFADRIAKAITNWQFEPKEETYFVRIPFRASN